MFNTKNKGNIVTKHIAGTEYSEKWSEYFFQFSLFGGILFLNKHNLI